MEIHYGALLERSMRLSGHSLSYVARRLRVPRATVKFWFTKPDLDARIFFKVEKIIAKDGMQIYSS